MEAIHIIKIQSDAQKRLRTAELFYCSIVKLLSNLERSIESDYIHPLLQKAEHHVFPHFPKPDKTDLMIHTLILQKWPHVCKVYAYAKS